jgi:hypothetical protein
MGGEEDPKDGSAVAGTVFGAVFIYIVRSFRTTAQEARRKLICDTGFLRLLRTTSLPPHARKPSRRDKPVMIPNKAQYIIEG